MSDGHLNTQACAHAQTHGAKHTLTHTRQFVLDAPHNRHDRFDCAVSVSVVRERPEIQTRHAKTVASSIRGTAPYT
jgi:hypothetical protein